MTDSVSNGFTLGRTLNHKNISDVLAIGENLQVATNTRWDEQSGNLIEKSKIKIIKKDFLEEIELDEGKVYYRTLSMSEKIQFSHIYISFKLTIYSYKFSAYFYVCQYHKKSK